MENLRNAFPDKTAAERARIARAFYRHLADIFVETLKLTHFSIGSFSKRFKILNPELLQKLHNEKRDVVAILGHFNNWEWLRALPYFIDYRFVSIYKPLKNKHFDWYINDLRSKYGMGLTPMSMIVREVVSSRNIGTPITACFLADQTPARGDIHYRTSFLNQDTPVYLGAGKIASKYDMALVFFNLQKTGRGRYELRFEILYEHSAGIPEHVITETHVRRLDEVIRENPEYWIWSHRRWKYKRE
jgi:KDO2-lipid IV(A) lauroyltransferase